MILVDTSVWVDHLRQGDAALADLLQRSAVLMHPFIAGELACGSLRERAVTLGLLRNLPAAKVATDAEVQHLIEHHALHGRGIGYVDMHLLASVRLTSGASLWTRDRRLRQVAERLGCAWRGAAH